MIQKQGGGMSGEVKRSEGEALLALYRFLRHPVQAGPMWVRYKRQGVDAALDVVESLMKKHGFEFKPANEPEAQ